VTTADDLRHIATHWADLRDQLDTPPADTWPPRESRTFVLQLEAAEQAAAEARQERAERTATALGERPVPIRLTVLDTITLVEQQLLDLADQCARLEPADIPPAERWRYNASWRHGAPWACTWLTGALAWLAPADRDRVTTTAAACRRHVEQALGLRQREDQLGRQCFCGGRLVLRHGGPQIPEVQCLGCGTVWAGGAMEVLLRHDTAA
jgi:hypothetical protein